jgi:Helix-turn-helix domain
MTTNVSEPLITEGEAASLLRVSLTSLRRWRREGRGPVYRKLGRSVRYRPRPNQTSHAPARARARDDEIARTGPAHDGRSAAYNALIRSVWS